MKSADKKVLPVHRRAFLYNFFFRKKKEEKKCLVVACRHHEHKDNGKSSTCELTTRIWEYN